MGITSSGSVRSSAGFRYSAGVFGTLAATGNIEGQTPVVCRKHESETLAVKCVCDKTLQTSSQKLTWLTFLLYSTSVGTGMLVLWLSSIKPGSFLFEYN